MELIKKEIEGVYEILLSSHEDHRGFFVRTYDDKLFKKWGIDRRWVQENHSLSKQKGAIRGIHFQFPPDCETKIDRAVTGEMFFVIVDLRDDSSTFGKHLTTIVSSEKKNLLYIPRGCAQGMCTLTDNCNLVYKVDNYYNPANEFSLKWNDPDLNINWPILEPAVISERDKNALSFKEFLEKYGPLKI